MALIILKKKIEPNEEKDLLKIYYNFFCRLYGVTRLFGQPQFKGLAEKPSFWDRRDNNLNMSRELIKKVNESNNTFLFYALLEENEILGRIVKDNNNYHISELISASDCLSIDEYRDTLNSLICLIKSKDDSQSISLEIPKNEELFIPIAEELGFNICKEANENMDNYVTYLLDKNILELESMDYGRTRSNKQTSRLY